MKFNKYAVLSYQKKLIENHYDFLNCVIVNNILICKGKIKQPDCDIYKIKIECVAGYEPKSTILFPLIDPCKEIHMYKDHSLCLHYSPDMKWNVRTNVFQYTIPWLIEWIVFYEIYKEKGVWLGHESPVHLKEPNKNRNTNLANDDQNFY